MQLVDNDTFISQLTALFKSSVEHGTVWLTHKRLTYEDVDGDVSMKPTAESGTNDDDRQYACLLRCTDGKDVKFSTKILPSDLQKFNSIYGTLLKSSMTTLRKRDKKREKQRQEQAALRKQRMTEPIVSDLGSKRGAGRRKWKRRVTLAKKQAESQEKFRQREEEKVQKAGKVPSA